MIRNYLLMCLLGICIYFVKNIDAHEAIINGDKAVEKQFPYQISLQYDEDKHLCGGGIIDEQYIVTAAHCFVQDDNTINDRNAFVLAGTNHIDKTKKPAVTIEIEKIFIPIVYNPNSYVKLADIAVVKLKHPLVLSNRIQKLSLPKDKHETYNGKTAKIAGFGWQWIDENEGAVEGGRNDTQLRYADVNILEYIATGRSMIKVPEFQLHGKVKQFSQSKPRGACRGDSGSPLVYGKIVIGILSQVKYFCSEVINGALYTAVPYYLNFIHNAMQDKPHKDIRTHVVHHETT